MGFEAAQAAMNQAPATESQAQSASPQGQESSMSDSSSNGDLAPDSSSSSNVIDLDKAERFRWEGKEMTPKDLKEGFYRQQDYTKKTQAIAEQRRQQTQAIAEERRQFEEERRQYMAERESTEKYESNIDADIQHVLRDPSMIDKFKEIYPQKYHAKVEQALRQTFGEENSPKRNENLLEQRLRSIEGKFQSQDMERAKQAFEKDVQSNTEILESNIARLSTKYPNADEDSVLARAEYMASDIQKDQNFEKNFSQLLEKLYKENNQFHEERYKKIYSQKVEQQKQANTRGRDIGKGGATPQAAPVKMKLKDVKNHILGSMGQS